MKARPIVGLDLVRFLAAFLVIIFHLGYWMWVPVSDARPAVVDGSPRFSEITQVAWFGWVGVEIFFVLSGFVIVHSASSDAVVFFRSRVMRLLPAAWVCAIITAAVLIFADQVPLGEVALRFARSVTFWPFPEWLDDVYWTLGIEISFYFLVWLLIRRRQAHRLSHFLIILGLASSSCAFAQLALHRLVLPSAFLTGRIAQLLLLEHGCFFAVGGLLAINLSTAHSRARWLTIGACVVAGAVVVGRSGLAYGRDVGSDWIALVPVLVWLGSVVAVIGSVAWQSALERVVRPGLARTLGMATYPLYLLHNVVGGAMLRGLDAGGLPRYFALSLTIFLLILASVVLTRRVEPPLRSMIASCLDRWLAGRTGQARPAFFDN